tara:strand:- start:39 stop:200 length:162 start_codon:yes stop_codon:yes gene_type:complete
MSAQTSTVSVTVESGERKAILDGMARAANRGANVLDKYTDRLVEQLKTLHSVA